MCAGRLELYKKNTHKIHARKRSFKEKIVRCEMWNENREDSSGRMKRKEKNHFQEIVSYSCNIIVQMSVCDFYSYFMAVIKTHICCFTEVCSKIGTSLCSSDTVIERL